MTSPVFINANKNYNVTVSVPPLRLKAKPLENYLLQLSQSPGNSGFGI